MAKESILILDTDKNIIWILKSILENEGYPVVIADSVERAIRDFSEFQVSGFITEYSIQNVCTVEAIRKLKEIHPECYVMMITDKEIKEDEYEAVMQTGADDYFLKPMSMKRVLLHLQKGLRYRNLLIKEKRVGKDELTSDSSEVVQIVPELKTAPTV